jgi:ankyrin repeat protein
LLAATSAGYTDIVKLLLERGANLNSVDALGVCSLFMACEAGDVPTVEALLGYNPDLSIREKVCTTSLAYAGLELILCRLLHRGVRPCCTLQRRQAM